MTMYQVAEELCTGCGTCVDVCPENAIVVVDGLAHITPEECTDCGACAENCPQDAIEEVVTVSAVNPVVPALAITPTKQPDRTVMRVRDGVLWEDKVSTSGRSRFWSAVGNALIWAGRELLPALWSGWRASEESSPPRPSQAVSFTSALLPAGKQLRVRRRLGQAGGRRKGSGG